MSSPTQDFLENLASVKHHPELETARGTLRIDLTDAAGSAERWFVRIDKGDVAVSHKNGAADCMLQADKRTFDSIVTGRTNAMAAMLREALHYEGDATLVVTFQRLFPAPAKKATAGKGAAK